MTTLVATDRETIQIEGDNSVGDSISIGPVTTRRGRMELYVEIDNPWSGDTESGFGRTASISISIADAAALGEFLTAWSDAHSADPSAVRPSVPVTSRQQEP